MSSRPSSRSQGDSLFLLGSMQKRGITQLFLPKSSWAWIGPSVFLLVSHQLGPWSWCFSHHLPLLGTNHAWALLVMTVRLLARSVAVVSFAFFCGNKPSLERYAEPRVKGPSVRGKWGFCSFLFRRWGFSSCEQRLHNATLLLDSDFHLVLFLSCTNSAWIDSPYHPKATFALFLYRDLPDPRTVGGSYTNNPTTPGFLLHLYL